MKTDGEMATPEKTGSRRVFLFLQGPSSPLFKWTGAELRARGFQTWRINICPGDWVLWHGHHAEAYRGTREAWPPHVGLFMDSRGVTDLVLLGEERPYHKAAIVEAERRGIDVYVVEMGYLRPDWITLERGGMSTNSHFPDDPEQIVAAAAELPDPDFRQRYRQSFLADAALDLAYNLPNVFFGFLYPHYRWHAIFHPLSEYGGWLKRFAGARRARRRLAERLAALKASGRDYFLYPLQLQTDYQIRAHSRFAGQEEAIEEVMHSFARHADPQSGLVFKVHPLDNGLIDWDVEIAAIAARHGLSERVFHLEGGDLDALIDGARGVVTVNSTVGIRALWRARPTRVLGTALFDIARLTDRQPLDAFWRDPAAPEPAVREAFFRLLAAAIHVRGNFYSRKGAKAGARAIARRLAERTVNEPGAYCPQPPRKARAS